MQNFIITLVLFLLSLFVSAQEAPKKFLIEKGTWSLGGSFAVGSAQTNSERVDYPRDFKTFSFNIRPDVGYFIAPNLQAGIQLGYGYSKNKYEESVLTELKRNSFSIAPYLRKFFGLSSKFSVSLAGSPYYNFSQNDEYSDNEQFGQLRSENYGVNIRPGIFFMLSEKFSLNADFGRLYYSHFSDSRDGEDREKSDQFGLSFSTDNIWIGLRYYIN